MSTPTTDDAAKVLADPTAYADDDGYIRRLPNAGQQPRCVGGQSAVSAVLGDHQARRHHGDRTRQRTLSQRAPPTAVHGRRRRHGQGATRGGHGIAHTHPHGRSAPPQGPPDRRRLVPPEGHARPEGEGRRACEAYVDKMADIGPECDFVTDIAVDFPLYVIMSLLGLPESDFGRMHALTQEMFGGDDDEYKRDGGSLEDQLAVLLDFFAYFSKLTASRREHPTDDLAWPSPTASSTANHSPTWTPRRTTSSSPAPDTTPPRTPSRAECARDRQPRRARPIAQRPSSDGHCRRGDDPMVNSRQGIHADRQRRHQGPRGRHRQG